MKPPPADHYSLFLMQRKDAGLKSPLLSLMSSVQRVLYETICSKPRWCCTGLHNSGFRSCHVGVHALPALEEAQTVPCNSLCFKALGNILKACPSPMSAVTSFARHWNTHTVCGRSNDSGRRKYSQYKHTFTLQRYQKRAQEMARQRRESPSNLVCLLGEGHRCCLHRHCLFCRAI